MVVVHDHFLMARMSLCGICPALENHSISSKRQKAGQVNSISPLLREALFSLPFHVGSPFSFVPHSFLLRTRPQYAWHLLLMGVSYWFTAVQQLQRLEQMVTTPCLSVHFTTSSTIYSKWEILYVLSHPSSCHLMWCTMKREMNKDRLGLGWFITKDFTAKITLLKRLFRL